MLRNAVVHDRVRALGERARRAAAVYDVRRLRGTEQSTVYARVVSEQARGEPSERCVAGARLAGERAQSGREGGGVGVRGGTLGMSEGCASACEMGLRRVRGESGQERSEETDGLGGCVSDCGG